MRLVIDLYFRCLLWLFQGLRKSVFDVSYDSVKKNVLKFKKGRENAFFGKDARRGHSYKLVGATIEKVQTKLETGQSVLSIAKEEEISEGAIRAAIKRGDLTGVL